RFRNESVEFWRFTSPSISVATRLKSALNLLSRSVLGYGHRRDLDGVHSIDATVSAVNPYRDRSKRIVSIYRCAGLTQGERLKDTCSAIPRWCSFSAAEATQPGGKS